MKINGNEIRPGNVIEHNKGLWVAVKTNAVKPGKGGAFNQVELKNLIDGTKLNERFRASETVERVRLEQKDYQYLYAEGDMLTFMDLETYDQIQLPADFIGERLGNRSTANHDLNPVPKPRLFQRINGVFHFNHCGCQQGAQCQDVRFLLPDGLNEGVGGNGNPQIFY